MANQYKTYDDATLLKAYREYGNKSAAAEALGCDRSTIHRAVNRARKAELADRGVSPVTGMEVTRLSETYDAAGDIKSFSVGHTPTAEPIAAQQGETLPGFAFKRISTNYSADGRVLQQWEIQSPEEAQKWREVERVLNKRIEQITPIEPTPCAILHSAPDLMNQMTIADGHVGAMAWGVETGSDNWDLKLSHSTILAGGTWLLDNLPDADEVIIQVLGDFTDTDGYLPATPTSKHILDVDGRFPRIVDVASDIIERLVIHALTRHKKVHLVIMPGNHDPLTAMWMRKMFARIFQNEPRVIVDESIRNVWCMEFGVNMIAAHHGDKIPMPQLPAVFSNDFAPMWGRTTFRYCHTGHLHHKHMVKHVGKQHTGMMVYQHPTISARNAWAAERGYPEARELLGHSYHIRCGMRTTLHFTPEMLK